MTESNLAPQISAVICTYNRADMLRGTLQSLMAQSLDKALYEVIVVDNNSTDHTSDIVKAFQSAYSEPAIHLVREPRQGLSCARNTGYFNSRGVYIGFLDDDARADPDWLEKALDCFAQVEPLPHAVGGPIFPFYDSPKPSWFRDEYEIRTWGPRPRLLNKGEAFSGSNMIFRKEVIKRQGLFDVTFGMKGGSLGLGEETDLFEKIWQSHDEAPVLHYSPQLLMFHWVPAFKMTVSYRLKRDFVKGQWWFLKYGPKAPWRRFKLLIRTLINIVRYMRPVLVQIRKHHADPNWRIERFAPIATEIGRLVGCLRLPISMRQG